MIIVRLAGGAYPDDIEQLLKCLSWIGYSVLSVVIEPDNEPMEA
jgi:hypothetical protein